MTKLGFVRKLLPLAVFFATAIAAAGAFAPPTWAQSNPPPQAQEVQPAQAEGFSIPIWIYPVGAMFLVFLFIPKIGWTLGLIAIGEREVGIVTKKFSRKNLPSSRLIALDGEGGCKQIPFLPAGILVIFPGNIAFAKNQLLSFLKMK